MPQQNPFEEFGGQEIATDEQQDPFAEFGGTAIEEPVKKKAQTSSTESLPQSEPDIPVFKSPTEIVSEFSGGGSLFPKGSENVDDVGAALPVKTPIKIADVRKVDAVTGKSVPDTSRMSGVASPQTVQGIIQSAVKHGIDPYTALAIAYQETKLDDDGSTEANPFHLIDNTADDLYDAGMKLLKEKMELGKRLGKKDEASIIQAFNGYGKVGKNTEGTHRAFYGIDVTQSPIDMNVNPVYGKRIIDIRENIIKKNPELRKFVEEYGNVDVSGEPPFAFPVNKEKIKTDVEESVKKIHADAGYSWERDANVIGRVDGNEPAPLSQEKLGGFFEGLRRGIEQHPMSDPLTKIAAESFVNSAQMTTQGLTDLSNATLPTEINNFWQTFELPAALVKTGFGAASMAVPSLQAFMAGFTAAEKVLPSDVIGFMMAPVQTMREKGGIVAFPVAGTVRIFDLGRPGDEKQAAAELTDLLFQILTAHGAKVLANKVIHNELLTPIEAQEMNRLVDEGFRDATILEREALKRVPQEAPVEIKVKAAPIIQKKIEAEQEIKTLETQKQNLDENFIPAKDEAIKEQEKIIEQANTELKSITEQKTETPPADVKTTITEGESLLTKPETKIEEKVTEPTLPVEEIKPLVENKADSEVSGGKLGENKDMGEATVLSEGEPRNLIGATVVAKKEIIGVGGKKKQFEGQVKIVGEELDSQGNTLYDGRYTDAKGKERSILLRGEDIKSSDLSPKTEVKGSGAVLSEGGVSGEKVGAALPEVPKTKFQAAQEKFEQSFKEAQENRKRSDQNLGVIKDPLKEAKRQAELDRQTFDDLIDYAREGINNEIKTLKAFLERIPDEAKRIAEIAWKVANKALKYGEGVKEVEKYSEENFKAEPPTTGITHAQTDAAARSLGLPEYEKNPETFAQWDTEAQKRIENKEMPDLVKKLESGEMPSAVEQRMMAQYAADLMAKITKNPTDELIAQYGEFKQLADVVGGRLVGQSLAARQNQVPVIENIADMYVAKREAAAVDVLTDAQKKQVEDMSAAYQKAKAESETLREQLAEKDAELKAAQIIQKEKSKSKGAPRKKKAHEDYVAERTEIKKSISDKLRDIRANPQAVVVPYARELVAVSPDVAKLVKSYVEEGVSNLADMVAKIHGDLKEHIPEITKKDVHDLIAGEYNKPKPTRTELAKKVADLKNEAKNINKLETLETLKPQTESGKVKRNQKIKALRDEMKLTPEEKGLELIKKRNIEATKKINERIAKGDFAPTKKVSLLDNRELKTKYPKLWKETMDAIVAKEDAQNAFDIALAKDQMARRRGIKKLADFGAALISTSKAVASGIDDSAVFIQNIVALVAHPKSAIRITGSIKDPKTLRVTGALAEHVQDFFSEKRFERQLAALHNSPAWDLIQKSGLDITEPKSLKTSKHEEIFDNNLLNKTFKFKGKEYNISKYTTKPFERMFTSLGNNLRSDAFIRMAEKYYENGVTWENNPKAFTDLAKILNNETGRGKLPTQLEQASGLISTVLWSPKLMASSANILGLSDIGAALRGRKGYYASLTPRMQVYAAASFGKYIAAGLSVMGLFALYGWEPDLDPTSVTFGTMEKDGRRVAVFGRFNSYVKFVAQAITKTRTIDGLTSETPTEKWVMSPLHFLRGKTTPFVGATISAALGKDYLNRPTTIEEQALSTITPLGIKSIMGAVKNEGVSEIFKTGLPSFVGINISYEEDFNRQMPEEIKVHGKEVELTETQHKHFQKLYDLKAQDYLNKLVNTDTYKNATDEEKLSMIRMTSNAAKTESENELKKLYPETAEETAARLKKEQELKDLKKKIGITTSEELVDPRDTKGRPTEEIRKDITPVH